MLPEPPGEPSLKRKNPLAKFFIGTKPEKIVKKIPEPTKNITNHGPQAKLTNIEVNSVKVLVIILIS